MLLMTLDKNKQYIAFVVEQNQDRDTSNTTDDKSKSVKLFVPEIMKDVEMGTGAEDRSVTIDSSMIIQEDSNVSFSSKATEQTYIKAPPQRNSGVEQPYLELGETTMLYFMDGDIKKVKYTPNITNESMRKHDKYRIFVKDKTTIDDDDKEWEFLLDSLNGKARIFTNNGRGEVSRYEIEIDATNGFITLKDYEGNIIRLDTKKEHIYAQNKTGSLIEIKGSNASIKASGTITLDSPKVVMTGSLSCSGSINASGSIVDGGGNTNHHGHP